MMRPGLTFKLSVLFACIGILASGLTGYYAYQANRSMLVNAAQRSLLTSTELLSQRLSSALTDIAADALVLAVLPSSGPIAESDNGATDSPAKDRVAGVFANVLRYHPEYSQIRLITRQYYGLEVVRVDRDGQRALRVTGSGLQEKSQFPYVFDTLALAPGHIYISPITVNHEYGAHSAEGRPTLRLATPVASASGAVVGVLVLDVDLASLLKLLQVDLPPDNQVYLANEWGDFLVHPDASQTFGFDKGRRIFMQDTFAATKPLFDKTQANVMLNGLDQPAQAPDQVLAFIRKPFGISDGNRFVVLGLSKPLADVLTGAQLLGHSIIRMVLIFSFLAIVLAIIFARALTQPLQKLAFAATHFFAEGSAATLPVRRTDEIGILARCFESMRGEIKAQMDVLYNKQHELTHLASHDTLTGLPNRLLFLQKLEQAIVDTTDSGEQLAVLFVDLDRFKAINDQYGHSVGDSVLIAVAERLRHALRGSDMVARLGGDEFIVLVQGLHVNDAVLNIANKILRALDEELLIDTQRLRVGASIGISQYPLDGLCAEELLQHADSAMYAAKSGGAYAYMRYRDMIEAQKLKSVLSKVGAMESSKGAPA